MSEVQILATGPELVRVGIRAIEPVVQEIILQARKEIQIVAYVFTPQANQILSLIQDAARRGVIVTFIVNDFLSQNGEVRSKIVDLRKSSPNVRIVDFRDSKGGQLHAKVVIVDRNIAVLGSANFSWGGMVSNYEIGVLIEGKPAWELAKVVDALAARTQQADELPSARKTG